MTKFAFKALHDAFGTEIAVDWLRMLRAVRCCFAF